MAGAVCPVESQLAESVNSYHNSQSFKYIGKPRPISQSVLPFFGHPLIKPLFEQPHTYTYLLLLIFGTHSLN